MGKILLFLDLSWGQSYIYGKAIYRDRTFPINIQYGRKALMLPEDLLHADVREATVRLYTDSGREMTLRYGVHVSRNDMIEIYDDELTNAIAKELPVEMLIEY